MLINFKKILVSFTVFTSSLSFASPTTVEVVWPFAPVSVQSELVKALINSANQEQTKYNFVFVNKPGAGGEVAVRYVESSKNLTVLLSSSSFYIRPLLYKNSYNVDDFSVVNTVCMKQPLALISKKYNSISELNGKTFTMGVLPGSITSLVPKTLKTYNTGSNPIEVPYNGTPPIFADVKGGHIDSGISFIGKPTLAKISEDVNILGITGDRGLPNVKTFEEQGIKGLTKLVADYLVFVPSRVDEQLRKDIHTIFNKALLASEVNRWCSEDFGQVLKTDYSNLKSVEIENKTRWKNIVGDVVLQ